ncbi:MAG: hypothetical protein AB7V19_06585 [Candidatus Bipolaricaulia bacterium]
MRGKRQVSVCLAVGLAVLVLAFSATAGTVIEEHKFKLSSRRAIAWEFSVYESGYIEVHATWDQMVPLELALYGPGQSEPYLRIQSKSPLDARLPVPARALSAGTAWQLKLTSPAAALSSVGEIAFRYPETLPTISLFRATLDLVKQDGATSTYATFLMQEFDLSWVVENTTEVSLETSCGPVPAEYATNTSGECPQSSVNLPAGDHGSRHQPPIGNKGSTYTLVASNDHGTAKATIRVLPKIAIGYKDAVCIGCMPCISCGHSSELERLKLLLQEVEAKLRAGCIRNNTNLDRFNDPYLRGALTDDMLAAMATLVIYPDDCEVPDASGATVCDTGYGYTPGSKDYLMICLRKGADGLTLLHELEHYVDPRTSECRASWVAQSCYGCPQGGLPCPTCTQ